MCGRHALYVHMKAGQEFQVFHFIALCLLSLSLTKLETYYFS